MRRRVGPAPGRGRQLGGGAGQGGVDVREPFRPPGVAAVGGVEP